MFAIYNQKLKTLPVPLESFGGLACQIYNPDIPQYKPTLCAVNYGSGRSVELNAPLAAIGGFAIINMPEFARVDCVEIGGAIYIEAEDCTSLLPGEYVYNPFTQILTIRIS